MFQPVPQQVSFPDLELEVLKFWKENSIYKKSLKQREGGKPFVFFEGPPTANGMPHPGHCLTRAMKDLFPRYRTMRGDYCERKAGWDTHGLPVEVEVSKELGIHSKEEIEAYGVEPFIHRCQQSVWRYMQEWEALTERIGFWIEMDTAYVTYHSSFVESVWWSLKTLFDRGLLYQGHKIVWWWAQGGTALSSGEVGEGYRQVADPSVYVRFPLLDDDANVTDESLLVWTTTPWTLPSNQFAAVHPDLDYATVQDPDTGQKLILAADLVETIGGKVKKELVTLSTCKGSELLGRRYVPPFDCYYKDLGQKQGETVAGGTEYLAWRIVSADFVTTKDGTGAVHQAPAFGEVDYDVLTAEQANFVEGQGPGLICAVGPDGKFTAEMPAYEGRWVKDCDKEITRELRDSGSLFHQEQYLHDYPFCPRAPQDALIQYPRHSWFIRTSDFKDKMLDNNRHIRWLPEHIRDGRFGNFLETNVDWALSRERYWGTPLPVWVCEETGKMEAIGCYEELQAKPGFAGEEVWLEAKKQQPNLVDDLKVHKPYIDAITYDSPFAKGAKMQRVSEVIDCWYDSGAMPFAQWGWPHTGDEEFRKQFPADFISEAIDQTRGWFYSQLAISTLLFGEGSELPKDLPNPADGYPHPFRNCIVLGLMLAEWWEDKEKNVYLTEEAGKEAVENPKDLSQKIVGKMSKRLKNYPSPDEVFDRYGADALRWYFFASQPPWNSIIYSDRAISESTRNFLTTVWNVFSFFVNYARSNDKFNPADRLNGEVGQLTPSILAKATGYRPVQERGELDRWLMSELHSTCQQVIERLDNYDNYYAAVAIERFVDALSNWYVRRNKSSFWEKVGAEGPSATKLDAYWTLYEALLSLSKLIAPFTPFLAETLWKNLTAVFDGRAVESVHLCDYPEPQIEIVEPVLSERMKLLRELASLGLSARASLKIKVRQPLSKMTAVLPKQQSQHVGWLTDHVGILKEELNVKEVEFTQQGEEFIEYEVRPNFKLLGKKLGKLMPQVQRALGAADGGALLAEMSANDKIVLDVGGESVELTNEEIEIRLNAREGYAAAQSSLGVVVLNTELTDDLVREGLARDIVRAVQEHRKTTRCEFSDQIELALETEADELAAVVDQFGGYIAEETQAAAVVKTAGSDFTAVEVQIGGHSLKIALKVV